MPVWQTSYMTTTDQLVTLPPVQHTPNLVPGVSYLPHHMLVISGACQQLDTDALHRYPTLISPHWFVYKYWHSIADPLIKHSKVARIKQDWLTTYCTGVNREPIMEGLSEHLLKIWWWNHPLWYCIKYPGCCLHGCLYTIGYWVQMSLDQAGLFFLTFSSTLSISVD